MENSQKIKINNNSNKYNSWAILFCIKNRYNLQGELHFKNITICTSITIVGVTWKDSRRLLDCSCSNMACREY